MTSLTHYAWAAFAVIDKTIVKLRDNIEAGFLAVKEYRTEELASDSSEGKRIKKAQERAFTETEAEKCFQQCEKDRTASSVPSILAGDDGMPFRGIFLTLSLNFQHGRKVIILCLPYRFVLWFSVQENENVFPLCAVSEMRRKEYAFSHFSRLLYLRNENE